MNHSTSGPKPVSKAISGFFYFKSAEGLAERTLDSYERTLQQWVDYIGEVNVTKITSQDISTYLNWLRTEYTPKRFSGKTHPLSPKTLRNIWVTLCSFFAWASEEYQMDNPMKDVPGPRFQKAPIPSP